MNASRRLAVASVLLMLLAVAVPVISVGFSDESSAAVDGSSDYYFQQLDADGKKMYNMILDKAKAVTDPSDPDQLKVTFDKDDFGGVTTPSVESGLKSFHAFYYDHPEVFWIPNGITYGYLGDNITSITFSCTANDSATLATQKEKVATGTEKVKVDAEFTYGKVKQIHDWIVSNTTYDTESVGRDDAYMAHNIYGVLVDKTGVCESYARTFMYLCQMNGINSIVSIGKGVSDDGSEDHMWNYVQMEDGLYYCMDPTWDDPIDQNGNDTGKVYYNYFLKGADNVYKGRAFTASHKDEMKSENGLNIPELSKDNYRLQPDGQEHLEAALENKDEQGVRSATYTIEVADIDQIREYIGEGGTALVQTENFQFRLTCEDLKKIKEKLEAESIASVTFGGTKESKDIQALKTPSVTRTVDVFTPAISTGDIASLGLSEMTVGIAVKMQQFDLNIFMYAWDVTDSDNPEKIKAEYSDGYEYFTVTELRTYCAGNNPIAPGIETPFVFIIAGLAAAVIILLLLIRSLLRRRKIKKMAKTMAKSSRNMQHYGQLYSERSLSSNERKAYIKAKKIYAKSHKDEK